MTNNETPRQATTPLNLEPAFAAARVRKHLRQYKDDYLLLGSGVVIGVVLTKTFRRAPKVDEAAIITSWMEHQVNNGFSIYALDPGQKQLWNSVWNYAEMQQKRLGWPMAKIVAQMVKDYSDVLGYGPSIDMIS